VQTPTQRPLWASSRSAGKHACQSADKLARTRGRSRGGANIPGRVNVARVTSTLVLSLLAGGLIGPDRAGAAGTPTVAALQVGLRAKGAYAGWVDGLAGPATVRALRTFQATAGLAPDGVLGPATLQALGALGRPALGTRPLIRGARGWDVAALQFQLETHGFPVGSVDGNYGARTADAVRRLQEFAGLPRDGAAGTETLAALDAPPVRAPSPLARPVAGPIVTGYGPRGSGLHTGDDFAAEYGTRVTAAAAGVVASVGVESGYGLTVVLDHGAGLRTRYAMLSSEAVAVGTTLAAGELIGRVGPTLHTRDTRLHFEVTVRGAFADPAPALSP
jgi:peptidoglycan hydrolase-like protein with peptidoglycan-binding domain